MVHVLGLARFRVREGFLFTSEGGGLLPPVDLELINQSLLAEPAAFVPQNVEIGKSEGHFLKSIFYVLRL